MNLAVLPTFAVRWLIPRLGRFREKHPDITVNLTTRLTRPDFQRDTVDAAIHFDLEGWTGTRSSPLLSETVIPMASPAVAMRHRHWRVADLAGAPLLHLTSRPDAWERWFHSNGHPSAGSTGMLLDQWSQVAEAAKCDLGIGLLPAILFEPERRSGQLVAITDRPMRNAERYLLSWPLEREDYHPLAAFRTWLVAETLEVAEGEEGSIGSARTVAAASS